MPMIQSARTMLLLNNNIHFKINVTIIFNIITILEKIIIFQRETI